MSFESDVIRFSNKSFAEVDRIRRGVILKLFTAVILDTPVDTGLLRGNWQTSVGRARRYQLKTPSKGGGIAINKIGNNMGKFGDSVYLTNNLPYAKVAEYGEWNGPTDKVTSDGFSKKASKGMVRKNAMRFARILKRVAKEK